MSIIVFVPGNIVGKKLYLKTSLSFSETMEIVFKYRSYFGCNQTKKFQAY